MSDHPPEIKVATTLPKDCDLEEILRLVAQRSGLTLIINRGTVIIRNQHAPTDESQTTIMNDKIEQTIQGGTFFGPVAANMEHCTTIIGQVANDQRKQLLTTLQREAGELIQKLPKDKQEDAAEELKRLVETATANEPKRRWYDCSAQGLLEASKLVKDFTSNIAGTIGQLGRLIWPDFKLPSADKE